MKPLGTVLPTAKSIRETAIWAAERERKRDRVAETHPDLKNTVRRMVGGEYRYYRTDSEYAIVSMRDFRLRWFEVRDDGDYAIRK